MKLIIGNKISEEQKEILMEQHKYFSKLFFFSFQSPPREVILQHIGPTENNVRLTLEEKESCEGLIMQQELQEAISSFEKGKSPGADGISVDSYQTSYESIKILLLNTFNWSYSAKKLSETQQQRLISLLLKHDPNGQYQDPTILQNWRPITLQCNDAKILDKCLANRLKKVLPNIIRPDQCGFLQGRIFLP